MKGFIYHHSTEGVAIFGMGKDVDKEYWFKNEAEAKEYAKAHKIRLPPFNRLLLAEMVETSDEASLLHDIWLILRSINHEKSTWDNVILPKFAEIVGEQEEKP